MRACTGSRLVVVRSLLLAGLLRPAAASAGAQAPRITPAGDPSVRNDTLYRLAVDPKDHPNERSVLLLDDGVLRYEADGTGTKTYRQITQILTPDAVEDNAEQEFSYSPGHQRLTVNWIRVVRPDGSVVSEKPTQVQDADVPATLGNPVYSDTKVRRYSLSGVAPGTLVDYSYTVEEKKPFARGDFVASWSVHTGRFTRRSRYVLDLPATVEPHLREQNLNFERRETVTRGRRVLVWATQDVPRVTPEDFMADSNGVYMSIMVAGPNSWEAIGSWYAGLARGRYTVTPAGRAAVEPFLAKTRTADDSLRAVQRWVAQDIRYVSIALGLGGDQPRPPADVVSTGYGDCKDKATLFVAVAGSLGYTAYPVLLNSGGTVDRDLPSIQQFDHAIAVVERPGGRVFLDLTADLAPYGELPPNDQGEFALVVHPDGQTEQVTLPEAAPEANSDDIRVAGTLGADGYLTASYDLRRQGSRQYSLRELFVSPLDSTHRADFARSIATKLYPGAEADSLQIFDGRDLSADARIALHVTHALAARPAGSGRTLILTLPFSSMRPMADAATALEAKGPRRFPIDAAKILGPISAGTSVALTLPEGWKADLPPAVSVKGKWGSYTATYTQEGNQLRISRRIAGARGVYPPEDLPDLTRWLRALAADDVSYIVLEPRSRMADSP
jgi:transglutaminase-like putative cysteine protease